MIETQFNAFIKIHQSSNGTEYDGSSTSYLDTCGITYHITCAKTSKMGLLKQKSVTYNKWHSLLC